MGKRESENRAWRQCNTSRPRRWPACILAAVIGPRKHAILPMAVSTLAMLSALGCSARARCAESLACHGERVCGFRGYCRDLSTGGDRFARSAWLYPRDWGLSGASSPAGQGGPALGDRMPIGSAEALLAFGPVPPADVLVRALLVLSPPDTGMRWHQAGQVVVEKTGRFRGGSLPPRASTGPLAFAAAIRPLRSGPARPVHMDLTDTVREASSRTDDRLYLLVRAQDCHPVFASPYHLDPRRRPRLELSIH